MKPEEWKAKRIADLQALIKQVEGHLTLTEDVGSGWVDITERSIERWNAEIAKKVMERDTLNS